MKQILKNLSYTLLATSLLCACSSESDSVTAVAETDPNAISFTSYVGDMTRQSSEEVPLALRTLQVNGFKVFANRTVTDWATDGANSRTDFMYDQTVEFMPEVNAWVYHPAKVWPKSDKVSFFAYSPYNSEVSRFNANPWDELGAAVVEYTHSGRIGAQDDLLAAASLDYNKAKQNGSVAFNFYHTLSKLGFAYSRETIAQTTTVEVSKMQLRYVDGAIKNRGVLDLGGVGAEMTADIWREPLMDSFYTGEECQAGSVLNGEAVLLIPQTYEDGQLELVVSYKLTTNDPALEAPIVDEVVDRVIALPAVEGGLQPNKQYLYTLEIKPNAIQISSDIKVGGWGEASSHVVADNTTDGIYYDKVAGVFHIDSAEGLVVYRDIVNNTNTLEVEGFVGIPNYGHAHAVLDQDIDLSTVCGPEKGSWIPIGDSGASKPMFGGQFDGQGHYIENLFVDRANVWGQGLFGKVYQATISNVKIRGAKVHGRMYVGALCGDAESSTITSCHVEADANHSVELTCVYHYGGAIAGRSVKGSISDCTVRVNGGTMKVNTRYDQVGALVGHINGTTVKNSSVYVTNNGRLDVIANMHYAGGLVGYLFSNGRLINCSISSSNLETSPIHIEAKNQRAGGLVGTSNRGLLAGCSSAVTEVLVGDDYAGYGLGYSSNTSVYGTWTYCATAPASNFFVGGGTINNHTALYSDGIISYTDKKTVLDWGIDSYNATVEQSLYATKFNAQGLYGPIYNPTQPESDGPPENNGSVEIGYFNEVTTHGPIVSN